MTNISVSMDCPNKCARSVVGSQTILSVFSNCEMSSGYHFVISKYNITRWLPLPVCDGVNTEIADEDGMDSLLQG